MSRTVSKMWAIVLSFTLAFACVPSVALASEANASPQTDDSRVLVLEYAKNPLFEDAGVFERERATKLSVGSVTLDAEKATEYYTYDEAVETLKDSLGAREAEITMYVYATLEGSEGADRLFRNALEEDGDPWHGDYLRWTWDGVRRGSQEVETGLSVVQYEFEYKVTAAQERVLARELEEVMDSLDLSGSRYDRVCEIYDYICDNVTYDDVNPDSYDAKYTAYAALVDGTAVCQGYATLFYLMAGEAGVTSRVIAGSAGDENHGWNIAGLDDGYYYNLDSTWDAGVETYEYFLKNEEDFVGHERWGLTETIDSIDYTSAAFHQKYPMSPVSYEAGGESGGDEPGDGESSDGEYTYQIEDGEVTILSYIGDDRDVVVPETIEGYPVAVIGVEAFRGADVDSITLQLALDRIGEGAFWDLPHGSKLLVKTQLQYDFFFENETYITTANTTVEMIHQFDQRVVADEYLASKADCTHAATYYLSCAWCDAVGEATFTSGEALGHDYAASENPSDELLAQEATCEQPARYYESCVRCGDVSTTRTFEYGPLGEHVFDQAIAEDEYLRSEATTESAATYYYSCACGEASPTEYFFFGDPRVVSLSRLSGSDAAATSAAISLEGFESSEWVIVARDDDFADAMSATGLAGALECPIILTDRTALSEDARAEIERLGATKCYIIGGKGAVTMDVQDALEDMGLDQITRVSGKQAWDTSVACATKIARHGGNTNQDLIVAMSTNFQDALSISSFAYKYKVPILLQTKDRAFTEEAAGLLDDAQGTIYVVGGNGAVPKATVEEVYGEKNEIVRLSGKDGYDTSNQIATYMVQEGLLSADVVAIACGAAQAKGSDALSGAALVGKHGGVLLLVNANENLGAERIVTLVGEDSSGAAAFLEANAPDVANAYLLGGRFVIPESVELLVAQLLGV